MRQSFRMNEWTLSLADVAEALGCEIEHVKRFIRNGEIETIPGTVVRVSEAALRDFVRQKQLTDLALADEPLIRPSLEWLRPRN